MKEARRRLLAVQRLLDDDGKLLQGERLRQKAEFRIRRQVARERILGIARNEDELQVRIVLAQFAQQRDGPSISGMTTSETTISTLPSSSSMISSASTPEPAS